MEKVIHTNSPKLILCKVSTKVLLSKIPASITIVNILIEAVIIDYYPKII